MFASPEFVWNQYIHPIQTGQYRLEDQLDDKYYDLFHLCVTHALGLVHLLMPDN